MSIVQTEGKFFLKQDVFWEFGELKMLISLEKLEKAPTFAADLHMHVNL